MALTPFSFTKTWMDAQAFPTYETEEQQVRADLQSLHDETKDALNRLMEELGTAGASDIGFTPQEGITAKTVQDALVQIHGQIQQTAAGMVPDGSLTKDKLASSLLHRVYGGRAMVSVQLPDAGFCPDSDYPLGQLWLRPGYTLRNLMQTQWQCSGCTMEDTDSGWTMTSNGEAASTTASQSLETVGQPGQRVLIYLDVPQSDSRMQSLELCLNGVEYDLNEGGGLFETALDQTGSLEIQMVGQWPFAFSGGVVKLSHTAAVNVQALEEELPGVAMPEDWERFLTGLLPFTVLTMEQTLYQQTAPGVWSVMDQSVLPVSRGGTGAKALEAGSLLKANEDGSLGFITQEALFALAPPSLEITTGTYAGTGAARTVTLPVIPKLLLVYPQNGPTWRYNSSDYVAEDNPAILADGCSRVEVWRNAAGAKYSVKVALNGETLTMSKLAGTIGGADLCNRSGVTYSWVALGGGEASS